MGVNVLARGFWINDGMLGHIEVRNANAGLQVGDRRWRGYDIPIAPKDDRAIFIYRRTMAQTIERGQDVVVTVAFRNVDCLWTFFARVLHDLV